MKRNIIFGLILAAIVAFVAGKLISSKKKKQSEEDLLEEEALDE